MNFFNGFKLASYDLYNFKIISIDFGHGDTSAARITPNGEIEDLYIADNQTKVIPTVLGYDTNGISSLKQLLKAEEIYPYFKEGPDLFDELLGSKKKSRETLVKDYFKCLTENLFLYNNPYILKTDKILLLIGCPSDARWDRLKYKYAEKIKAAVNEIAPNIKHVVIMSESKAAIINALEANHKIDIKKGIIVFDFGSLTSDCTFILPKSKVVEDFSIPLGASMIEKNILKIVLHSLPESVLEEGKEKTLLNLRKGKEDFFYTGTTGFAGFMRNDEPDNPIHLTINQALMDRVIKGEDENGMPLPEMKFMVNREYNTWYNFCKKFFIDAKTRLQNKGASVKTIIITGGARRMPFIEALCKEVFNDKSIDIIPENNPAFSVSRGLCYAGYRDMQAVEVLSGVKASVKNNAKKKLEVLAEDITKTLADRIYYLAKAELYTWSTSTTNLSINNLSEPLEKSLKANITATTLENIAKPLVVSWLETIRKDIETTVNSKFKQVYNNQISVETYQITDKRWKGILDTLINNNLINSNSINLTSIIENIDLTSILGIIIQLIMMFAIVICAFLLAVPLYIGKTIVNFFTGDAHESYSDVFDEIADTMGDNSLLNGKNDPSKPLSKGKRTDIYKKFSDDSVKFTNTIAEKIKPEIIKALNTQYDKGNGFGIGSAVENSLEGAIEEIALQRIINN